MENKHLTGIMSEMNLKTHSSAPPGVLQGVNSEADLRKLIDAHQNGNSSEERDYGVAFGLLYGKCKIEGCAQCPHYEPAVDQEGGVCINCGHNVGDHEIKGKLGAQEKEFNMNDIDPLGLLKEPGEETETPQELEARKKLQDLCDWKIDGSELRFLDKLGSGQAAKVYKGKYKGNMVAIKVLRPIVDEKQMKNFKKELDVMSAIVSPCVVQFFGGCLYPKICLVMEYCSNGSVFHLLQRKDLELTWDFFFKLCTEIASGVEALHAMDPPIVHRDLKSLNLLVDEHMAVKVCDFGLSRFTGGGDESTLNKMRGTYAYTAPEVYFGEKYSTKSDVYSVGVILWEVLTRCISRQYKRPYSEFPQLKIDFQIIIATAKKGTRPTIPKTCPQSLIALMQRCWSAKPEERPSAVEVLDELKKIQQEYEDNKELWMSFIEPKIDPEEEKRKKAERDKKAAEDQLKKLQELREKAAKEKAAKEAVNAAAAEPELGTGIPTISAPLRPKMEQQPTGMFQHSAMDDLIAKLSKDAVVSPPSESTPSVDSAGPADKEKEPPSKKDRLKRTTSLGRLKGKMSKKPNETPTPSNPTISTPSWTRFGGNDWMEEDSFEDDKKTVKKKESAPKEKEKEKDKDKDKEKKSAKKSSLFGRKKKKNKWPEATGTSIYQLNGSKAVIRVFHWEHGSYATLMVSSGDTTEFVTSVVLEKFHLTDPKQYCIYAVSKKEDRQLDNNEKPAELVREHTSDTSYRLWLRPRD